jgi:hypothetical protein
MQNRCRFRNEGRIYNYWLLAAGEENMGVRTKRDKNKRGP